MISTWLSVDDEQEDPTVWGRQIIAWILGRKCKYEFDPWKCKTKIENDKFWVEVIIDTQQNADDIKTAWKSFRYLGLDRIRR